MKHIRIEGARKLGSYIEPMTAKLSDQPAFDDTDWIFEIKWDGYRAIAEIGKKDRKLYSRNGLTFDRAYPKVFDALNAIKNSCVLDGEIVVFDEQGKPSFQKMQNYQNTQKYPIQYYVFDCLEIEGKSITNLPLIERKVLLKKLLPESNVIRYCDHVEGEGIQLFKEMKKLSMEGMIAKRRDSKYHIGKRSADWLKIKNIQGQEAIIVGYTQPKGSRQYFGSLALAVKDKKKFRYIGNVGTGFDELTLKKVYGELKPLVRTKSPLSEDIKELKDATWVEPKLVCNISFSEITEDGSVRHPVFQGLRIDKSVGEIKLEKGKGRMV